MKDTTSDLLLRLAAAIFSGVILVVISPPIYLHALHWVSYVPLFLAVRPDERRCNFFLGYLCGFIGTLLLFFWLAPTLHHFAQLPFVVSFLILLLYAAFWALPYGLLSALLPGLQKAFGPLWIFVLPVFWVAMEFLFPALFPYYQGLSQYRVASTFQIASVVGVYGVTYLVILANSAFAYTLQTFWRRQKPAWLVLVTAAAIWGANFVYGMARYEKVETQLALAPTAHVALLQQALAMNERKNLSRREIFDGWLTQAKSMTDEKIDLMIWPEGSVLYNPTGQTAAVLAELTHSRRFFLLTGATAYKTQGRGEKKTTVSWNSAYLFGPDGKFKARYDKMILLPFGEALPRRLDFLRERIPEIGNFVAGTHATRFRTDKFTFTTPICYEAILETQMRRMIHGDVMINITNDSWFGPFYRSTALHQHAMLAIANAVKFGQPLVRSATSGINVVVEPHGRIIYESQPFKEASEVVELRLTKLNTPYRRWGKYFPHAITLIACAALVGMKRSKYSKLT